MCRHFPTDPNNVGADCPKETSQPEDEEEEE